MTKLPNGNYIWLADVLERGLSWLQRPSINDRN